MQLLELSGAELLSIVTDADGAHLSMNALVDQWSHNGHEWVGHRHRQLLRISVKGVAGPNPDLPQMPCVISGGSIAVGTLLIANRIQFPKVYEDTVTLRLESGSATLVLKRAKSLTIQALGDASFVEHLSADRFVPPSVDPPRDELSGVASFPLDGLGTSLEWLRDHLLANDVRVHPKSSLAQECAKVQIHKNEVSTTNMIQAASIEDAMNQFARARGIDFISKAIHLGISYGLRPPPHLLKSLASGDPNIFAPGTSTQGRNFSWELFIGSVTRTFTADVAFQEPDIVCSYTGRRIEVAAKMAYSVDKLWGNVEKGILQSTSAADVHFVFVNVVRLMDRLSLLRRTMLIGFQNNEDLVSYLQAWASEWCNETGLAKAVHAIRSVKSRPTTIAFFMPCVVQIRGGLQIAPMVHLPITTDRLDYEFSMAFQQACNRVWGGPDYAGSPSTYA